LLSLITTAPQIKTFSTNSINDKDATLCLRYLPFIALVRVPEMRLLKIEDDGFSLELFPKDGTPPYAILSHTWGTGKDEVTYQEVIAKTGKSKPGS
jgi:hypothetical protein